MPQRLIAIGDIHGCARALATLLAAVRPAPDDVIVPLGDYIDRGPDSRLVIEQLWALSQQARIVPLLGNHEEMMLEAAHTPENLRFWLHYGGRETLMSYGWPGRSAQIEDIERFIPTTHLQFIRSCVPYHETEAFFFTHANYQADRPLDRQTGDYLRWLSLYERSPLPHQSGKVAILGHTAQFTGEVLDLGYLKCIDTYCYGGQWLTALDVRTGQIWQANEEGELRESDHSLPS